MDNKERVRVELKTDDLKGLSLGTKVRITMEGAITELRAPETYSTCGPCASDGEGETRTIPPCAYVLVDSKKVVKTGDAQIDSIIASDENDAEMDD